MFFPWWQCQCLIVSLTTLMWFVNLGCSAAPTLAPDEVEALKQIAETLGKKGWNFNVDPCSKELSWFTPLADRLANQVNCNCSYDNNTTCHVVSIVQVGQNLSGKIPPELIRLPYLQRIELSANYLNGTIPPEWGTMQQLQIIILPWNRVTGRIPSELANISTLQYINLDTNQLSGNFPPEFGDLLNIKTIILTSNNLTGELPASLANLKTLKEFRISDNNFSGSIPKFIENWTSVEILILYGSGLSGPIPSGIASMTNLSDLRISDLNSGNESNFPFLSDNKKFDILILRSCNIIGQLPSNIWNRRVNILDLSFNKLSGPIPDNFSGEPDMDYIYLTGNLLTGPIPDWMQNGGINIDLSYNNLKSESTSSSCQTQKLNFFASSKGNTTGIVSCLRSVSCKQTYHSLYINCGGGDVDDDNGTTYEMDNAPGGPSNFDQSGLNWGSSNTGHFLENSNYNVYIRENTSSISGKNPQLYMDARVSPLSLSYYGFCLGNGNYTINLHFSETAFTDHYNKNSLRQRAKNVAVGLLQRSCVCCKSQCCRRGKGYGNVHCALP